MLDPAFRNRQPVKGETRLSGTVSTGWSGGRRATRARRPAWLAPGIHPRTEPCGSSANHRTHPPRSARRAASGGRTGDARPSDRVEVLARRARRRQQLQGHRTPHIAPDGDDALAGPIQLHDDVAVGSPAHGTSNGASPALVDCELVESHGIRGSRAPCSAPRAPAPGRRRATSSWHRHAFPFIRESESAAPRAVQLALVDRVEPVVAQPFGLPGRQPPHAGRPRSRQACPTSGPGGDGTSRKFMLGMYGGLFLPGQVPPRARESAACHVFAWLRPRRRRTVHQTAVPTATAPRTGSPHGPTSTPIPAYSTQPNAMATGFPGELIATKAVRRAKQRTTATPAPATTSVTAIMSVPTSATVYGPSPKSPARRLHSHCRSSQSHPSRTRWTVAVEASARSGRRCRAAPSSPANGATWSRCAPAASMAASDAVGHRDHAERQ